MNGCSRSIALHEKDWRNNIVAVVTRNRAIDDSLKKQIKNQTFYS